MCDNESMETPDPKTAKRFADEELESFHQEFVDLRLKTEKDSLHFRKVLESNTKAINSMAESTSGLVEAWNNAGGFIWTIQKISRAVKILAPIGLLIGGVVYFIKAGHWPEISK